MKGIPSQGADCVVRVRARGGGRLEDDARPGGGADHRPAEDHAVLPLCVLRHVDRDVPLKPRVFAADGVHLHHVGLGHQRGNVVHTQHQIGLGAGQRGPRGPQGAGPCGDGCGMTGERDRGGRAFNSGAGGAGRNKKKPQLTGPEADPRAPEVTWIQNSAKNYENGVFGISASVRGSEKSSFAMYLGKKKLTIFNALVNFFSHQKHGKSCSILRRQSSS